jgi:hypothetical protein
MSRGAHGLPTEPATEEVASAGVAEDGAFEIAAPAPGQWTIVARAVGYVGLPLGVGTGTDGVELRLAAGLRKVLVRVCARPYREPVAGAVVVVGRFEFDSGPPPTADLVPRARALTDEHGEARVEVGPAEGLLVAARGFATCTRTTPRSVVEEFELRPGDRIEGVVLDESGAPVPRAQIRASGLDFAGAWESGADGRFVVEGIEAMHGDGPEFHVRAPSGGGDWSGRIPAGTTDAIVVLSRSAPAVSGVVLHPDGSPAAGAALAWGGSSGSDGRFHLTGIPPGRHDIGATWRRGEAHDSAPERRGSAIVEVPSSGSLDGVTIRMQDVQRSWVTVRVLDAEGNRVPDESCGVPHGRRVADRTDAAVFAVDAPPATATRVWFGGTVAGEQRFPTSETPVVTQATADAEPVILRLPALREIVVEVEFPEADGPPLAAWRFGSPAEKGRTLVGLGMRYAFALVAPTRISGSSAAWNVDPSGPLILVGLAAGHAEVRRPLTQDEVAAGRAVLRLERGAIVTGRVVCPDPAAVAGAPISLARSQDRGGTWHVLQPGRTEDGRFRFEHVAHGRWTLVVHWPQTQAILEREVEVTGDANLGDVAIPAAGRIRGSAMLPDGRPAGGASVRFLSPRGDGEFDEAASFVRSDGTFEVAVAADARGALLVSRAGSGTAVARADASLATPVQVTLEPEGRLEVRIRLPRRLGGAWSSLVRTPDDAARWQPASEAAPDVPGFDRVESYRGLAPGPIVAVARGLGWRLEATATVVAGRTAVVVLEERR